MWLLVVTVMGMSVYSNTYPTLEACQAAGRQKAIQLALQGKQGAIHTCTPVGSGPKRGPRAAAR